MRKTVFILTLVIACYSCGNKEKLPAGVMTRDKMQSVMWDMMRASEFLNTFVFLKDTSVNKVTESEKWYDKVYELHKISRADFDKSYAYYRARPEVMKDIMDTLSAKQISATTNTEIKTGDTATVQAQPGAVLNTDTAKPPKVDTLQVRRRMKMALDSMRPRKNK